MKKISKRVYTNLALSGLLVVVLAGSVLVAGPWFPVVPESHSFPLPEDLDAYLAGGEKALGTVKPGQDKRIFWAHPATKDKTPLALVYLHGFSASRGELSPLAEDLARDLDANLFMTRLTAHGRRDSTEAFGRLTAQDLIADAEEALAIGNRIGEKVILIGMSTGAALAFHLGLKHPAEVSAIVSLAANFQPRDGRAKYISGPLGPWLARVLIGKYREFETENTEHAEFWTSRYRSEGIVALMDTLNYVARLELEKLKMPVLTIYTRHDEVVDVDLNIAQASRIQSAGSRSVDGTATYHRHVLAGRILNPKGIAPLKNEIAAFLNEIAS